MIKSAIIQLFTTIMIVIACVSCSKVDSNRIPYYPVHIELDNAGLWNTYGVSGVGTYRKFIKSERIPANFSYSAMSYTGFGGVLLMGDINAVPIAYDLACPVEAKKDVRVSVNDAYEAVCPVCGSTYNILEASGAPMSGKAIELKYGLQRYNVVKASIDGYIIQR